MRGLPLFFLISITLAHEAGAQARSTDLTGLPVIEHPAALGADSTLAVVLSGDGGWAAGDRAMAAELVRQGFGVVGLDVPSYLRSRKTPDVAGADLARLLRHYAVAWHVRRVLLVGYSHGANILPFMASRLPADLRSRIDLIALLGLEPSASFEFHLEDVVADVVRGDAVPVLPELEKLAGMPILCVMGEGDRHSLCGALPPGLARVEVRPGGHRITGGEGKATADMVLAARTRR
jgi:type IV secretory pathway VirJ component